MINNYDQWLSRETERQMKDDEYTCPECDRPVEKDGEHCSSNCFDASMR
jgi:hypothetical protein